MGVLIAAVSAGIALWALLVGRRDRQDADSRLERLEEADRPSLQFGTSWGRLTFVRLDKSRYILGAVIPVENVGKRPGAISVATWDVTDKRGSILYDGGTALLRPRDEWPGQGDTTVPAGVRRLFLFPLAPEAEQALDTPDHELRLYIRQVGDRELIRASITRDGVVHRPWTAEEEYESEQMKLWMDDQAAAEEARSVQFEN